jgi:hypothetical protein
VRLGGRRRQHCRREERSCGDDAEGALIGPRRRRREQVRERWKRRERREARRQRRQGHCRYRAWGGRMRRRRTVAYVHAFHRELLVPLLRSNSRSPISHTRPTRRPTRTTRTRTSRSQRRATRQTPCGTSVARATSIPSIAIPRRRAALQSLVRPTRGRGTARRRSCPPSWPPCATNSCTSPSRAPPAPPSLCALRCGSTRAPGAAASRGPLARCVPAPPVRDHVLICCLATRDRRSLRATSRAGARALELGSGTGLVGLVAAALGVDTEL